MIAQSRPVVLTRRSRGRPRIVDHKSLLQKQLRSRATRRFGIGRKNILGIGPIPLRGKSRLVEETNAVLAGVAGDRGAGIGDAGAAAEWPLGRIEPFRSALRRNPVRRGRRRSSCPATREATSRA